jgi:long-chain acyl-CoA synthetase
LHTGDIGHLDDAGRIMITDRKKDMIVNDKGDNISPQKIEGMLTLQPEIAQAMVSGDKRPYVVGLIVPDAEWALDWAREADEHFDLDALQDLPAFRSAVRAVDRVNTDLSVIEKVRQFAFADEPFSIENEEMTPSMKIRRHKIANAMARARCTLPQLRNRLVRPLRVQRIQGRTSARDVTSPAPSRPLR